MLYTEKTPAQALSAINARMQAKESAARSGLGGWVEKGGMFSLSVSSPVIGRFTRRTVLHGKIERENGVTVVRGDVPSGVDKQGQIVVFVALALVALLIFVSGNVAPALIIVPLGAYLYIPMTGDRINSAVLMNELQRTLKTRQTPPKKTDAKDSTRATGTARVVTSRSAAPKSSATTRSTSTAKSTTSTRKPASGSNQPK